MRKKQISNPILIRRELIREMLDSPVLELSPHAKDCPFVALMMPSMAPYVPTPCRSQVSESLSAALSPRWNESTLTVMKVPATMRKMFQITRERYMRERSTSARRKEDQRLGRQRRWGAGRRTPVFPVIEEPCGTAIEMLWSARASDSPHPATSDAAKPAPKSPSRR